MKCPKCGYLGFEQSDRCRNCGYDFALATQAAELPELPLRPAAKTERFADLSLAFAGESDEPAPSPERRAPAAAPPQEDRVEPARRTAPPAPAAPPAQELPLFGGPITDDVPLITRASPPRPPLAVRRATPEVPRLRSESPRTPSLDLDLDSSTIPVVGPAHRTSPASWPAPHAEPSANAGIGARFVAAVVDLVILAVIDLVVIYFTMQICFLTVADIDVLPKAPLLAFLAVQNIGYLVAFTVGGQTLGKMATGIRVVADDSGSSVDVGRALMRTLAWLVLAAPAGLGFLTALLSADRRGLHDRFAGTRVVRAA